MNQLIELFKYECKLIFEDVVPSHKIVRIIMKEKEKTSIGTGNLCNCISNTIECFLDLALPPEVSMRMIIEEVEIIITEKGW